MNRKLIYSVMLAMVLAFGMAVVGCDDSGESDYNHGPIRVTNTFSSEYQVSTTVNSTVNAVQGWVTIPGGVTKQVLTFKDDWDGDYITLYYQPSASFIRDPNPNSSSIGRKRLHLPEGEKAANLIVSIP